VGYVVRDQRNCCPAGPRALPSPPLGAGPWTWQTTEANIKVSIVARGIEHPYAMAFMDDGAILVTERIGRLRVIRNGVLDPTPLPNLPPMIYRGTEAGMMDLALHPNFERNHAVYISYTKPLDEKRTTLAVARAVWDGKGLREATDIFVGEGGGGGPIVFGGDGMLYVASGGGGGGGVPNATQLLNNIGGKILRLTDTGSVPKDNPFVGRADARPEIFTMGHRNTLRMAMHPATGAIWQVENGPNGGDEANILVPGANYGWPIVSLGRTYAGPWQGPFSKEGFRDATVLWIPSIAVSSIAFYTGDRLPKWKGDVFVGGMRYGEIPGTGQLHRILINKNLEELRREPLLVDLRRRIRDVKQGRDGLLYVLTDGEEGAILKIEPAD